MEKICFISLGSYSLFCSDDAVRYVGGAEVKQVLLGKNLAQKGYHISYVTLDEDGKKSEEFKKINLIKSYKKDGKHNAFHKIHKLWQSFKHADADIYIQSCGTPFLIALFCFIHRKKYIRWLSSNNDVLLRGIRGKTSLLLQLAMYLDFKLVDLVIAQNLFQKQIIDKRYKKPCSLMKNPIIIPELLSSNHQYHEDIVLWVGTIRSIKQPELFLNLAESFPQYTFRMIGGSCQFEPHLYQEIQSKTRAINNLEFKGFIPYDHIYDQYKEASVLVNTSKVEGFPNTFLEAWIHSIPVISLHVDPDEIICTHTLGFHSKSCTQLVDDLQNILSNKTTRDRICENVGLYVKQEHDVNKITDDFISILHSLNKGG